MATKQYCILCLLFVAVVELAKQDTDLFLERSYSEKAAAIDEYCSYDDLLDQSQAGKVLISPICMIELETSLSYLSYCSYSTSL